MIWVKRSLKPRTCFATVASCSPPLSSRLSHSSRMPLKTRVCSFIIMPFASLVMTGNGCCTPPDYVRLTCCLHSTCWESPATPTPILATAMSLFSLTFCRPLSCTLTTPISPAPNLSHYLCVDLQYSPILLFTFSQNSPRVLSTSSKIPPQTRHSSNSESYLSANCTPYYSTLTLTSNSMNTSTPPTKPRLSYSKSPTPFYAPRPYHPSSTS